MTIDRTVPQDTDQTATFSGHDKTAVPSLAGVLGSFRLLRKEPSPIRLNCLRVRERSVDMVF
jgi:hypothetical protein